jgi:hypothetical protein
MHSVWMADSPIPFQYINSAGDSFLAYAQGRGYPKNLEIPCSTRKLPEWLGRKGSNLRMADSEFPVLSTTPQKTHSDLRTTD